LIRLLATGDVHLGRASSKVSGPGHRAGDAWRRICRLARERQADAVLVAGDLINLNADVMASIGDLKAGFGELGSIPVYAIAGNHDFESLHRVAKQFPDRLIPIGRDGKWEVVERSGYRIVGNSFGREREPDSAVMPDFALDERTLVLAHGDIDASSPYRPHDSRRIEAAGGHWIFGHVHSPGRRGPNWRYTSSPQALDPGEPGEHGVWLVEFESAGGPRFEFLPISSARYEKLPVDVSGLNYAEAEDAIGAILAEYAQSATLAVVRIDLIGRSSLKAEDINRLQFRAQEYSAQGVTVEWVRGGQLRPPIDLEAIAASQDGIARLAQAILSLQRGTELDSRLGLRLAKVQEKLVDLKFKDEAIVDRTINSAYRVLEALL